MTSVKRVGSVLPRWDYLPEKAGLAMSQLETSLGKFRSKLDLSFDREKRIVVRMSSNLETEAITHLKAAGVKQGGGQIRTFYSFQGFDLIIAPYEAAQEARRNKVANEDVDAVEPAKAKKQPLNILDNLDVKAPSKKIALEQRTLVNLEQKGEGSDPFGLFQEGLDPANENPLRIDNDNGNLEISVAGFAYADGERDGKNFTTITPLEFSASVQRYHLVNTYGDEPSYELLFNVDRQSKSARVWMREHKDGKWSGWGEVADYGK